MKGESTLAGNHEGDGGAGGEGGPAQAQAAEHGKTLPAPRCGRTATHAMGGMKGAPGLAGRDPPRDVGPAQPWAETAETARRLRMRGRH